MSHSAGLDRSGWDALLADLGRELLRLGSNATLEIIEA